MGKKSSRSKKRSASKRKPPEPTTYFVDRSLGRTIVAEALCGAGARVEVHDDHFAQDADDPEWLLEVGDRGWVVLTKDKRIRQHALAKLAIRSARVRAFFLTSGNMTGDEMGEVFVKHLAQMERFIKQQPPPFIAIVSRTEVTLLSP